MKYLFTKNMTLLLLLSALSFSALAQGRTYHISVSSATMYTEASEVGKAVKTLKEYDNVELLGLIENSDWAKVKAGDDIGFVHFNHLSQGKAVAKTYTVRTGATCKDGSHSNSTGSGTCSHHGGVAYWLTEESTSFEIIKE